MTHDCPSPETCTGRCFLCNGEVGGHFRVLDLDKFFAFGHWGSFLCDQCAAKSPNKMDKFVALGQQES